MRHTIQVEIKVVVAFVAAIWIVFLLEFIPPLNLLSYGLTPRTRSQFDYEKSCVSIHLHAGHERSPFPLPAHPLPALSH